MLNLTKICIGETMEKKDVSIILVNYKTKDLTRNCINSIVEKTQNLSYEIFVVDNDSQDGTCEMIKTEFPWVKLIENPKNSGFGAANNLAIRQSSSKYVFLLNTDTILVNNAIKILCDFMDSNITVGACGANLYDENMEHVHSYGVFPTVKRQFLKTFMLRWFFPKELRAMKDKGLNEKNSLKSVDYITGADVMIKKSVLDEVGIFNERFFMYFEENELQFRIRKAGYEIFINPEAKIIHLHDKSPKKREKMYYEYKKSQYLFFRLCYANKKNVFWIKMLMILKFLPKIVTHRESISKLIKFVINDSEI